LSDFSDRSVDTVEADVSESVDVRCFDVLLR